jgi:hypothetical protein
MFRRIERIRFFTSCQGMAMSNRFCNRSVLIFLLGATVSFATAQTSTAQTLPSPATEEIPNEAPSTPNLEPVELFSPSPYDNFPWMQIGPSPGEEVPFFRDTEYGSFPTYGNESSPGVGYPHQEMRPTHYGIWYRPQSYRGSIDWYEPMRFNPRGVGMARHGSPYRLDYAPAVVQIPHNQYGPYYYPQYQQYDYDQCDKPNNPWWKWWGNAK